MGIQRKLVVEVIDARNLLPKDGHGTSSPYVVVDFYGQRRKTRTVTRDLSPVWNETLEFNVGKPSDVLGDMLELDVYHDKFVGPTTRNNFLGRVKLSATQFVKKGEEALIYYPLEKKHWLSWISGEIGLKIYFVEQVVVPEEPKQEPPAEADHQSTPLSSEAAAEEDVVPNLVEEVVKPSETPTSDVMDPPPELPVQADVKRSVSLGSIPEVKVSNTTGPRLISRASSVSSFVSDAASSGTMIEQSSTFDLVEKMHYLFVRVVKARSLPTVGSPVVKIVVSGSHVVSKPARKTVLFEWDQTFAFGRDAPDHDSSSSLLEVSVWDPLSGATPTSSDDVGGHVFLGGICFDVSEIPVRDPPDSPLAPQWYRLEGGGAHRGDLMLATWFGTQADESFPEAWKTDSASNPSSKSKVYQSPKLWYLRSSVIEAQDIISHDQLTHKESSYHIKAQLGFQVQKTKSIAGSPCWNEDLIFVAAEPFSDQYLLVFLVEARPGNKEQTIVAVASIPLSTIERRVDERKVASRWFTFDQDPNEEKRVYKGRVHLRLCFDGGYHVMDEAAHVCSDYRPTARQLWKAPIGTVELGIIGCNNLLPMKTTKGKGTTDAYVVAKYGNKWIRTRTISDSLQPRWNEQYTWRVYDPSTVLTIGVFDGWEVVTESYMTMRPDFRIGKVRVRISTLTTGKVYKNTFPLLLLSQAGLKKMGEIELAVRFIRSTPTLDFLHVYSQPLLPMMHHVKPIGMVQQESLRTSAVKIVASHLTRSEPPLRREVVTYMLDHADSHSFSMRKVRANWYRIIKVIAGVIDVVKWVEDTRGWKNPTSTLLVHALVVMLVWFPDLIIPSFAFYVFVIGAWNYRFRARDALPHFDPKMSLAESLDRDELDEEFDALPCTRPNELVRARYDKLRVLGARIQTMLGDLATQGERMEALVTWRDPRATGIFIGLCFVVAFIMYLVPSKMVVMAFGFYYLRHPIFRDRMPSPALNFFRRLPSLSDRML